ncbi:hypothetical protein IEO21_01449 [Rhodonia placenta]|uniref:F-box domain-containing protein n=1 Tax=Rhodonia placenta TaxID=104341 RepID=A0A8H7P9M0_9APHY|nr:hypothetical protein IEO21_01449 [Postia placenta]
MAETPLAKQRDHRAAGRSLRCAVLCDGQHLHFGFSRLPGTGGPMEETSLAKGETADATALQVGRPAWGSGVRIDKPTKSKYRMNVVIASTTPGTPVLPGKMVDRGSRCVAESQDPPDSHPIFRLPQELWDEIIGYIGHDQAALSACSLTCRAWAAAFRPHLFHHLRLTARSLAHIQQILHSNRHLAKCTTRVTIDYEGDPSVLLQLRQHTVLAKVLSTLPNVTRLKLLSLAVTPSLIAALSTLSPHIRELIVGCLVAPSLEAYAQFIRAFPHLHELSLQGVLSLSTGRWFMSPTPLARLMHQLRFTRRWRRATDHLRGSSDGGCRGALYAILHNIPLSLGSLCVASPTWSFWDPPELEVLTFMNEHWLPVFLFAMDLTRMREITFLFSSPVVFDQMVRVLSSRLSLSELWELQSVVFVIGVAQPDRVEDYTADLELIREITPHLHAAGSLVLRIFWTSHAAEIGMYRCASDLGNVCIWR